MLLGDLPAFRRDRLSQGLLKGEDVGFRSAAVVPPSVTLAELAWGDAPAIVFITLNARAHRDAELLRPDPELLSAGILLEYPVRSVVTGGFLAPGLVVVPRVARNTAGHVDMASLTADLVVPRSAGSFHGNGKPEQAFEVAYLRAQSHPLRSPQEALFASVGADKENGLWWVLGTFAGLLGEETCGAAWERTSKGFDDPEECRRMQASAARRVRLRRKQPVMAFDEMQSRAVRALLPRHPCAAMWADFVQGCAALGGAGAEVAARYDAASRYLWDVPEATSGSAPRAPLSCR